MVAFSTDIAKVIRDVLEEIPDGYWVNRKKINSIPTEGITDADYWFLGDRQMPKELRELLWGLAPTIERVPLGEVCVNRYEPGNGMPEHIDRAYYRHNMVIALNDDGDGIEINGVFYPDSPGKGVIFPIKSEPHKVPPVATRRYVIIFLYS
uniref:DNA endonuclease n=1 Tax=Pseudomonas phage RVTF4 TaxID=3236931 RepID=A0AB39CCV6_9VIRU